jgi:lysophospholipase L1-like esterase
MRRQIRFRHLPMIALITIALLLVLELAAGFWWRHYRVPVAAVAFNHVEYRTSRFFQRDRELFWRLRPSRRIEGEYPGVRGVRQGIAINALGLRGREIDPTPPPGAVRLICLGDSHTFGWRVADDQTFPVFLENQLNQDHRFPVPIEVVNAGVPGYSSFQGARFLRQVVLPLKPQVAILAYGSNDDYQALGGNDEELARRLAGAPDRAENPSWLDESSLVRLIAEEAHRLKYETTAAPRLRPDQTLKYVTEMIETCRQAGVVVLLFPTGRLDIQEKAARQTPVPVESFFAPEYLAHQAEYTLPNDTHPNAAGYRAIAAYLAGRPELREMIASTVRFLVSQYPAKGED